MRGLFLDLIVVDTANHQLIQLLYHVILVICILSDCGSLTLLWLDLKLTSTIHDPYMDMQMERLTEPKTSQKQKLRYHDRSPIIPKAYVLRK